MPKPEKEPRLTFDGCSPLAEVVTISKAFINLDTTFLNTNQVKKPFEGGF